MSYTGPERRNHRVLVTKNTEYHLRGAICVAVRPSQGQWCEEHEAVGSVLEGSLGRNEKGGYCAQVGTQPEAGHRLCFSGDLLTSPLLYERRPSLDTVRIYAA